MRVEATLNQILLSLESRSEPDALRILDENPQIVHLSDDRGFQLIHCAVMDNSFLVTQRLLQLGADVNARTADAFASTPLHFLEGNTNKEIIRLLLDNGADVNVLDSEGTTPLLYYCRGSRIKEDVFMMLVDAGTDIHKPDDKGNTLLHCTLGYPKLVTFLLKSGADVNAEGDDPYAPTPLHIMMVWGKTTLKIQKVLRQLLAYGADANHPNAWGKTALHLGAIFDTRLPDVQILVEGGADVNAVDDKGWTPLHVAADSCSDTIMEYLIQHGTEVNKPSFDGETPLHRVAYRRLCDDSARLLLSHGADIHAKDAEGNTPLHVAAREHRALIAKVLLEHGADRDMKNRTGETPLMIAESKIYRGSDPDYACAPDNTAIVAVLKQAVISR